MMREILAFTVGVVVLQLAPHSADRWTVGVTGLNTQIPIPCGSFHISTNR